MLRNALHPEIGELPGHRRARARATGPIVEQLAHELPKAFGEARLHEVEH